MIQGKIVDAPTIKGTINATLLKGDKGDKGDTPQLSIGEVTTLEPNESATVQISDTVISFGIPRGVQGERGLQGIQGERGEQGFSITNVTDYYALSRSKDVNPASLVFTTNVPTMTALDRYLWTYTRFTLGDGSTVQTNRHIISVYGDKGDHGVGVSLVVAHYQVCESPINAPTKWDKDRTLTPQYKYLWSYETFTFTNGSTFNTTPRVIGVYGDRGIKGEKGDKGDKGDTGATGVAGAKGDDGFSPTVSVTDITGGHRVTITDAQGSRYFDVMNGKDGEGSGGTSDYTDLTNKPSIAGVILEGNKTLAQLGIAASSDIPSVPVQSVNGKTGAVTLGASDVGALPNNTTASDLGAYVKPSGGISKTDLANGVQSSLGLADSAYQKPSGGIPASDLASGVIPNVPVQSVNGQTGAVVLAIPSSASDVGAIAAPASPATGAFLVWSGSAWVAQTLSAWQGGSY